MFDYDKWQEIFNTIKQNKLRTFLTAFGVFWGILMLLILMGAGTGLQNGVFALFGSHARNALYVWSQRTTMPYMGLPVGRVSRFTNDDIQAIKDELPNEIEYMSPRLFVPAGEIIHGDKNGGFDVRGDTPDLLNIDALRLVEGRYLNQRDLDERRKVAVIGKKVRTQLYEEDEEVIGSYLRIKGTEYLVIGVINSDRNDEDDADEDEKTIIIPLSTAQQITNRPNRIGWFVCTIDKKYSVAEAEDKILALLKKRHKVHPDDPRALGSDNIEQEVAEIMTLFKGIKFIVWFVGIGSLLFGIIGVGNIMLIIVKDRTKEIGIRKAMGATPRSIISLILLESVFITTIAGYLGLVQGIAIVYAMKLAAGSDTNMFQNPEINLGVGIGATLILIIAGALTGLVPAIQAANINPVDALKDE